jgi:oxepin-CoA hydrolase/3-oxo-5,6-dehydrosuberyl-CoA semialdehyde dehydrogenase
LECKEELYTLSYRTGATRDDSWIDIDGGIGTVFAFAGKGARELPNSRVYLDGASRASRSQAPSSASMCICRAKARRCTSTPINFPVWGMLEKLSPALLAGIPVIVKPATATAYLTELAVRRIIESGHLAGRRAATRVRQLGDLFDHLTCQDMRLFHRFRAHGCEAAYASPRHSPSVPFVAETDSLNSSIFAPDAVPAAPSSTCSFARWCAR